MKSLYDQLEEIKKNLFGEVIVHQNPAVNKKTNAKKPAETKNSFVKSKTLNHKANFPKCRLCGKRIQKKLLKKHLNLVHGVKSLENKKDKITNQRKISSSVFLRPRKDKITGQRRISSSVFSSPKKAKSNSNFLVLNINFHVEPTQLRQEICPVCCGDGGVRGGCRKCEGTGWVSSEIKASYHSNSNLLDLNDNSKVSNASYPGNNQGAFYRERDGRIGSIPTYDDYSEESDC